MIPIKLETIYIVIALHHRDQLGSASPRSSMLLGANQSQSQVASDQNGNIIAIGQQLASANVSGPTEWQFIVGRQKLRVSSAESSDKHRC